MHIHLLFIFFVIADCVLLALKVKQGFVGPCCLYGWIMPATMRKSHGLNHCCLSWHGDCLLVFPGLPQLSCGQQGISESNIHTSNPTNCPDVTFSQPVYLGECPVWVCVCVCMCQAMLVPASKNKVLLCAMLRFSLPPLKGCMNCFRSLLLLYIPK